MHRGELIYENSFSAEQDLSGFVLEGSAEATIHEGTLRLQNLLDESEGQRANYVYWCPREFPSDIWAEWEFWPETPRGLCIMFFAARGRNGEDIFDPGLSARTGEYDQYHSGEINAFHISYYRRRNGGPLNTCNLRKSYGFHLAAIAPDPIPSTEDAHPPYRLRVVKLGAQARFWINDLPILSYDDDQAHGPLLDGGKIGFRQMAPMIGRYANLRVYDVHG